MRKFGFAKSRGGAHLKHSAGLNLTPMIDMMTIILVFLIKSYSVSPSYLTPTQEIKLSTTTSENMAPDRAVLIIGKNGILIEGKNVVPFKNGTPDKAYFSQDTIPALYNALVEVAKRSTQESSSGTIILQADKGISFDFLRPVLRTVGVAGYHDIKFAGVYEE